MIMPYIKEEQRICIDGEINELADKMISLGESCNLSESDIRQGVFNYVITKLSTSLIGNPKYSKINEVVGAMECCKLELYRRMAANYEDKKASENGDVYNT